MVALDVKPLILKNVLLTLKLAADTAIEFQKHISAVALTPKADSKTWKGLGLNSYTDTGLATWTCDLTFIQDWLSDESLSQFLFDNEGATVAATFQPISGAGISFTANLSVTPGAIGGKVDEFAEVSVSLGSDKPVKVPAA